ncbi:MAG: hypothetical protein GXP36_11735 [Actinobacteria bacterium]|nr:hypothetical protein [Actinomycetota bacterium]
MARLPKFSDHRFVGDRSTMTVFDTDDAAAVATLADRIEAGDLLRQNLLQTFGPDTLAEARNRGFNPSLQNSVSQ